MKKLFLFLLSSILFLSPFLNAQVSTRKGWWKFDDSNNLLKAEANAGQSLQLVGTHQAIDGPAPDNGAVKIGVGSYYKMVHGIAANGGGKFVNDYTLQIDFRVPTVSGWHCFFQITPANDNDGDCFINTTGHIGTAQTGYSDHTVLPNEWYRLIISVENGVHYSYYLDGLIFHEATVQGVDGRFALDSLLLMFADNDGEDNEIDCAELAIWDHALTKDEVFSLGSYHAIDVTPPNPVTDLNVTALSYQNLIMWTDVPDESGETYDVYYSDQPITDITKAEILKRNIPEGTQTAEQILRSATTDTDLSYYYAIVCKDYSGNESTPYILNTPTINKGKGVPTISATPPPNFAADGDLEEWANIPRIKINSTEGTGFVASGGMFDGDADCSAIAYLAVDDTYLYVALDVTDDIYSWKKRTDPWMNDAVDLFIGLFDAHNTNFSTYQRGATPHYQMRFDEEKVTSNSSDSLLLAGPNYFFMQKFTAGYIIEAKIPFEDIAHKRNYNYTGIKDSVFHPKEGMRIPIDFTINDADASGNRELVFTYSPYNNDQSWNNTSLWLWTWVGNKMVVDDVNDSPVPSTFALEQNYPNPFNPTTNITYSLANSSVVTLKVYDVLGREVAVLVNKIENAGAHTVSFNGSGLSSGIYFYKLEAGSNHLVKKLMLLK